MMHIKFKVEIGVDDFWHGDALLIKFYKVGSLHCSILYERKVTFVNMKNTKELIHCHYGTSNRAPRLTFTDP